MSVNDVVKRIKYYGNLKPLPKLFDQFGEEKKSVLKEVIKRYLYRCKKALIKIAFELPKTLYNTLDAINSYSL